LRHKKNRKGIKKASTTEKSPFPKSNNIGIKSSSVTYKSKTGRVIDAAETARQGIFLDIPTIICKNIE